MNKVAVALAAILLLALCLDWTDTPLAAALYGRLRSEAVASSGSAGPASACSADNGQAIIAGVLRNDGRGWYALRDGGHEPINIASVESNYHSIAVRFAPSARSIRTFIVVPDEALARAGIIAGASVDLDRATITLARRGVLTHRRISPALVDTRRFPNSNLWIYSVVSGARCQLP